MAHTVLYEFIDTQAKKTPAEAGAGATVNELKS